MCGYCSAVHCGNSYDLYASTGIEYFVISIMISRCNPLHYEDPRRNLTYIDMVPVTLHSAVAGVVQWCSHDSPPSPPSPPSPLSPSPINRRIIVGLHHTGVRGEGEAETRHDVITGEMVRW